jgi:hypothetical protein
MESLSLKGYVNKQSPLVSKLTLRADGPHLISYLVST